MKNSRGAVPKKSQSFVLPSRGSFSYKTPQKNSSKVPDANSKSSEKTADRRDIPSRKTNRLEDTKDQSLVSWGIQPGENMYMTLNESSFVSPPKESYRNTSQVSPHTSRLGPNLIPREMPQIRPGKKVAHMPNELQLFSDEKYQEPPQKTGLKMFHDIKFTMDPLLRENKDLRYHIIAPMSLKERPIWEPTIHKHVKHFTDNLKPDWFDNEGNRPEDPLDEKYKSKILEANDVASSFVKYVSIDRRYPKQSRKKTEGLNNVSLEHMDSIMRHDFLYADDENKPVKRKNLSLTFQESEQIIRHRRMKKMPDLGSMTPQRQPRSISKANDPDYTPPYYLKRRQQSIDQSLERTSVRKTTEIGRKTVDFNQKPDKPAQSQKQQENEISRKSTTPIREVQYYSEQNDRRHSVRPYSVF